jgi:hypothetical protein
MICTRRDFLRASTLGLLAGTLPRSLAASPGAAGTFRELRHHVGIFTSRGGTIGWMVNRASTVVDSQFTDTAEVCLDGLQQRGAIAVDALINTHHPGDHTMRGAIGSWECRLFQGVLIGLESAAPGRVPLLPALRATHRLRRTDQTSTSRPPMPVRNSRRPLRAVAVCWRPVTISVSAYVPSSRRTVTAAFCASG